MARSLWAWIVTVAAVTEVGAMLSCQYEDSYQRTHVCTTEEFEKNHVLRRFRIPSSDLITTIRLTGCALTKIETDAFDNVPSLRHLDISGNRLKYLITGVFHNCTLLLYLDLSRNQLKRLPEGLFENNVNLQTIDLKHNHLYKIAPGVFGQLKSLRNLNLIANAFNGHQLVRELFANNREMASIRFSKNAMNGAPNNLLAGFEKLSFLALERCKLSGIPQFVIQKNLITFNNLQLKGNSIRRMDDLTTFVNLLNLNILDLSENMIAYLDPNIFRPLTKLKFLNLSKNVLTIISGDIFNTMSQLSHLDLSYNMLMNIPDNSFMGTQLKILNLTKNRITYLKYNFCTDLRNSNATLEVFFFNHNPFQCACLRDLMKEVKSLNITYVKKSYKGRKPVCVTTDRFVCERNVLYNNFYESLYTNTI